MAEGLRIDDDVFRSLAAIEEQVHESPHVRGGGEQAARGPQKHRRYGTGAPSRLT